MKICLFTIFLTSILACQDHIVVPLTGVPMGRPYTQTGEYGARLNSGVATLPLVQGVADEVHNPDGETINPIPGDPLIDPVTGNVNAGFTASENPFYLLPVIDLAITIKDIEFGYSNVRGTFILWDFIKEDHFTFSYSPSYSTFKETAAAASDGAATEVETTVDMEAKTANINNTVLSSIRTGEHWWGQVSLYAGLGLNAFTVSVEDKRTVEKKQKSSTAFTGLIGLYLKLAILETTYEVQTTNIKNRDRSTTQIQTYYSTAGINLSF